MTVIERHIKYDKWIFNGKRGLKLTACDEYGVEFATVNEPVC